MTILHTPPRIEPLGPRSAGILMTPREFDEAEFEEGWRYELINGVLVVSAMPFNNEIDPNEELGRWLRNYQEEHPRGSSLDYTGYEQTIALKRNRRRMDRAIWAGLGRRPRRKEVPTIAVEFLSKGKRSWKRDYIAKRREYLDAGIKEYWLIDRFQQIVTVFTRVNGKNRSRVYQKGDVYETDLLPGFELPLARLLELAERWPDEDEDEPE